MNTEDIERAVATIKSAIEDAIPDEHARVVAYRSLATSVTDTYLARLEQEHAAAIGRTAIYQNEVSKHAARAEKLQASVDKLAAMIGDY